MNGEGLKNSELLREKHLENQPHDKLEVRGQQQGRSEEHTSRM
jgi:hypothetical protein